LIPVAVFPDLNLTSREREVLDEVLRARTRKAIAHKLGISTRTVDSHIFLIMKKTSARSLVDLCRKAWRIDEREAVPSSTLTEASAQQ
jgi:FixJ family two-component response regulator